MATLKWNEIAAPQFGTAIQGLNVANNMVGTGLNNLASTATQYGDREALAALARYSDPTALNRDVASGAFNTDNASAQALRVLMQRPGQLIGNQQQQGILDQSREMNPLLIQQQMESNRNREVINPLTESDAELRNTQNKLNFDRSEQERAFGYVLDQDFANAAQAAPWTPESMQAFVQKYQGNPEMQRLATQRMQAINPEFGKGIVLPSFSSIPAGASSAKGLAMPSEIQSALSAQETSLGIPAGVMSGIAQKEVGGRLQEFLDDPAKYHYEVGADGKRKSTAFGPFGILDSTAANPGYGVKPLQNKSLPEQIRFASEYAAARTKAEGGNWERGLDRYGTGIGTGYGASILNASTAAQQTGKQVATTNATAARAQDAAAVFGDTSTANRVVAAHQADPTGSKSPQEMATTLAAGSLSGVDVNDIRSGIEMVMTELGVSPSVASSLVQESVSSGFLSGLGGLGFFDKQVIDMDKLEKKVESIAGKKVNGKRQNIDRFNTVFDAMTKQATIASNREGLETSAAEAQKVVEQIRSVQANMPEGAAKSQALNALTAQLEAAEQKAITAQQQALGFANTVIPPAPVAAPQPTSQVNVVQPPTRNNPAVPRAPFRDREAVSFYSPAAIAERARVAAERNAGQVELDNAIAAENAQKELTRRKQMQSFANFREQAGTLLPR